MLTTLSKDITDDLIITVRVIA